MTEAFARDLMAERHSPICPHCGYDLKRDEMIELDGFRIDPRGVVEFAGKPVRLNLSSVVILATLAKAAPRVVASTALIERIGCEGEKPFWTLRSQVWRLRRKLKASGAPAPIIAMREAGYRWELSA